MPELQLLIDSFNVRNAIVDEIKSAKRNEMSRLIDDLILNEKLGEVVNKDVTEHPWVKRAAESADASKSVFKGPVGFMVLNVRNTAAPKVTPESTFAPRMLKVTVTDGYQAFSLLELDHAKQLSVDTPPGTKIILNGDLVVRKTLILIKPSNVQFVGGRVDDMLEKWQVTKDFATKAIRDSGAPKFVPFGKKIDNLNIDDSKKPESVEEDEDKTEKDVKFGAVRDQNLEAVKQLKNEMRNDPKLNLSAPVVQLPAADFIRERKDPPVNSSGVGNRGVESEFSRGGRGEFGGRGGRSGRRGRRGGRGSESDDYDDTNGAYKAPTQQASLFDLIQNKMNDITVQDIEYEPTFSPRENMSMTRDSGLNRGNSSHIRGRGRDSQGSWDERGHQRDWGRGGRGGRGSNQQRGGRYGARRDQQQHYTADSSSGWGNSRSAGVGFNYDQDFPDGFQDPTPLGNQRHTAQYQEMESYHQNDQFFTRGASRQDYTYGHVNSGNSHYNDYRQGYNYRPDFRDGGQQSFQREFRQRGGGRRQQNYY